MFDELAAAASEYGLEPAALLRAATYGGAAALGFGAEHGAIAPDRPAHLLAVTATAGARVGADPYALLFGRPDPGAVSWAAGPAASAAHPAPAGGTP
jgi:cytosine/adenosine deaminase-related metal-dependent hydrolase